MNKIGFSTQDWVIALILFSGVFALYSLMIVSQATTYRNVDIIDQDLMDRYDKLEQSTSIAGDAFRTVSGEGGLSLIGVFDVFFSATFGIIRLIFGSLGILELQVSNIFEDFGVNDQVTRILFRVLLSVVTVIIVWRVIGSTTRGRL